jgi:membrane-bound ClpP family serine protease
MNHASKARGKYHGCVMRSLSAHRWLATLFVLALYAVAAPGHAEVTTVNGATWITGEITPRDLQALRDRKQPGLVVHLHSGGGMVTSAIAIGRLLREVKGVARVEAGSSCLSACVFVLAGAPYRVVQTGAVVGIHRPYDPNDLPTASDQQKLKHARLDAYVRAYLKQMNVPLSLYEAMLKAPEVRHLPPPELGWYGLNATDRKQEADDVESGRQRTP